jgi:hypothetical protein
MARPDESNTRATLLGRLAQSGDPDEVAWGEFVEHYGRKIRHHAWRDFADAQRRPGQGQGGDGVLEVLRTAEAREDLARRLEEEFDHELLTQAITTVRAQVAPQNWEAFHLTAVEGGPHPRRPPGWG